MSFQSPMPNQQFLWDVFQRLVSYDFFLLFACCCCFHYSQWFIREKCNTSILFVQYFTIRSNVSIPWLSICASICDVYLSLDTHKRHSGQTLLIVNTTMMSLTSDSRIHNLEHSGFFFGICGSTHNFNTFINYHLFMPFFVLLFLLKMTISLFWKIFLVKFFSILNSELTKTEAATFLPMNYNKRYQSKAYLLFFTWFLNTMLMNADLYFNIFDFILKVELGIRSIRKQCEWWSVRTPFYFAWSKIVILYLLWNFLIINSFI